MLPPVPAVPVPGLARERPIVPTIAQLVPLEFRFPKFEPCLGHSRQPAAGVPVPKTSVNKNNLVPGSKYQIWTARQILLVEAIAVAEGKHEFADKHLRARVLRAHPRHDL